MPAESSARKHVIAFFIIGLTAAVVDIVTKWLAFRYLGERGSYELFPGVLHFSTTKNTGIVFGLFKHLSSAFLVIAIVAVPVIVLIFLSIKRHRVTVTLALGLILGGTFGNMYDRVMHDGVRDFIYIKAINWPVFNIADSAICIGVVLLSIMLLFTSDERTERAEESAGAQAAASATDVVAATGGGTPQATPPVEGPRGDAPQGGEGPNVVS